MCATMASCGSNSIEKTARGLVVNIDQEAIASKVELTVYDVCILGVSTTGTDKFMSSPSFLSGTGSDGTPFDTHISESSASVTTDVAGVSVNRLTSELTFTDSVGNVLLTLIPGEVYSNNIERAIDGEAGAFQLIYTQADAVVPDTVSHVGAIEDLPLPLHVATSRKIATDGYNILWKSSADGSQEQVFIVFGEQVNLFGTLNSQ